MPIIRAGMRKPPPGFDAVNDRLDEFEDAMKQAVQDESKGVIGQTTKPRKPAEKRPRYEEHDKVDAEDKDGSDKNEGGDGKQPQQAEDDLVEVDRPIPPLWRVAQINRERTRYVFDACFRARTVRREVFDYCCEMNFVDAGLAKRWRLPGYERLCCTACGVPGAASVAAGIATKFALRDKQERKLPRGNSNNQQQSSHGSDKATCICRVPAAQRKSKSFLACAVCGCKGCCSTDASRKD